MLDYKLNVLQRAKKLIEADNKEFIALFNESFKNCISRYQNIVRQLNTETDLTHCIAAEESDYREKYF